MSGAAQTSTPLRQTVTPVGNGILSRKVVARSNLPSPFDEVKKRTRPPGANLLSFPTGKSTSSQLQSVPSGPKPMATGESSSGSAATTSTVRPDLVRIDASDCCGLIGSDPRVFEASNFGGNVLP